MREGVAELAAFVDGAGSFRRNVAGDAARERELLAQLLQAVHILADVRVNFAVCALQIGVRHKEVASVARAGNQNHVLIVLFDHPVQVNINEVLPRDGPPVTYNLLLDVIHRQRLTHQGVIQQVQLGSAKIVCSTPVSIHFLQILVRCMRRSYQILICHLCILLMNFMFPNHSIHTERCLPYIVIF